MILCIVQSLLPQAYVIFLNKKRQKNFVDEIERQATVEQITNHDYNKILCSRRICKDYNPGTKITQIQE
jgi:hypothetical protein